MKIIFLGVQMKSLANFRAPLIRDLIAAGHQVVAIAPEAHEESQKMLAALGATALLAPLKRQGMNPLRDAHSLLWLIKTLYQQKADSLLCFQPKAVIYGLPAAALAGIRHRTAMIEGLGLGFIQQGNGWKRKLVRALVPRLYRFSLRFAHHLIFLNPDDRAVFEQHHLLSAKTQIHRINGIGVDLTHYQQQPLAAITPDAPFTFLMIARLLVDKGVREYAAAAAEVKKTHPNTRFVLIGGLDGGPASIKADEVATWQAIDYKGEMHDVRPDLAACHVFVLPSYREGVPRSTMEALATGRAIITTDAAGTRETVVAEKNGLFIKVADAADLARAMRAMLEAYATVESMGHASRQLAEEKFEVSAINQQICRIIGV